MVPWREESDFLVNVFIYMEVAAYKPNTPCLSSIEALFTRLTFTGGQGQISRLQNFFFLTVKLVIYQFYCDVTYLLANLLQMTLNDLVKVKVM